MNNDGKHFDIQQSAAILVYLAFNEGHLQPNDLTSGGLNALDYAEKLLMDNGISTVQLNNANKTPFKVIGRKL